MTILLFANQAQTNLALPITASDTQITVAYGTGSIFPQPALNQAVTLTLVSAVNSQITEIVSCTNITGDVLTVVRAQEGTIARSWSFGDFVTNLMTAGTANAFAQIYGLENAVYAGSFTSLESPTATLGNAILTTGQITTAPVNGTDIANKTYVDAQIGTNYIAGTGLDLTGATFSIAPTGVTAGSVGSPSQTLALTVNAEGQISSINAENISISPAQVFGLGSLATQNLSNVLITGGTESGIAITTSTIDSTPVGSTTPSSGNFTNLVANSTNFVSGQITTAPANPNDIANKAYVDGKVGNDYTAGTGLDLNAFQFSIADTGITSGTYGLANETIVMVLNAQGQVTSITPVPIAISNAQVSGLGTMSTQNSNNVNITGGTIANIASSSVTITGGSISGTTINANTMTNNTITGGSINGTIIGNSTAAPVTATVYNNMTGGSF